MRGIIAALAVVLTLLAPPALAEPATTMIVMDGSGSMWGQIDGRPKLEIARETATTVLAGIPGEQRLGLMAYGHRARGDCSDIELMVEPAPGTGAVIGQTIGNMRFQGKTPITEAVRQAAETLRYTEEPATVVLVTDGIETCEADPCALATELEAAGVDFTAHVIGFGLSRDEGAQVACIAQNTGGRFIQADDAEDLADALNATVSGEAPDPSPVPNPEPRRVSRHFPGAEFMPNAALAPTGDSFGDSLPYPDEPDFSREGTVAQCQTICTADTKCGSWRYEPKGSYFVDHARCFLFSPATEFDLNFYPDGEGWASGMKDGVIGLTRPYVPLGFEGVEAGLRVPGPVAPGAEFTVLWSGPAGHDDWVDIVPLGYTELSGELSYFYVNETIEDGDLPEGAGVLTAPSEPGLYDLRYVLGRSLDRRVILTLPIAIGDSGPATGEGDETSEHTDAQPVAATFRADDGGLDLSVTWSAVPVAGQNLPPEAWAMQDGVTGAITERFLPGDYDVLGDAGDTLFAGRVRITSSGPNDFVIPYSGELSPAGEDEASAHVCDSASPRDHDDPTGLSFTLPAGWQADAPFFYETASGVRADRPTVTFTDADGLRVIELNPIRWVESNGICSPSPAGELCVHGQPDGTTLIAIATILPSLRFVSR